MVAGVRPPGDPAAPPPPADADASRSLGLAGFCLDATGLPGPSVGFVIHAGSVDARPRPRPAIVVPERAAVVI